MATEKMMKIKDGIEGRRKSGRLLRTSQPAISKYDDDDNDYANKKTGNAGEDNGVENDERNMVGVRFQRNRKLLSQGHIREMISQGNQNGPSQSDSGGECSNSSGTSCASSNTNSDSQSSQVVLNVDDDSDEDDDDDTNDEEEDDDDDDEEDDDSDDESDIEAVSSSDGKKNNRDGNRRMATGLQSADVEEDFEMVHDRADMQTVISRSRHFDLRSFDEGVGNKGFQNYHKGNNNINENDNGENIRKKSKSISEHFSPSYADISITDHNSGTPKVRSKHKGDGIKDEGCYNNLYYDNTASTSYAVNKEFSQTIASILNESSDTRESSTTATVSQPASASSLTTNTAKPMTSTSISMTKECSGASSSTTILSAEEKLYKKTMELFPHLQAIMDGFRAEDVNDNRITHNDNGVDGCQGDESENSSVWHHIMSPIFPDLMVKCSLMRRPETDPPMKPLIPSNSTGSGHPQSTDGTSTSTSTLGEAEAATKASSLEVDKEHEEFIKRLTSPDSASADTNTAPAKIIDIFKPEKVKRHKCPICGKAFGRSSDMRRHVRIHTGEKNHICPVCPKRFNQSGDLQRHIKTHSGVKPHICTVCGKGFSQKGDVKIHMRIHTGERPHLCQICNKTFNQSSYLATHMKSHRGERNYACDVCDKAFVENSDLKKHMRTHSGEKPHECTICHKTFNRNNNLVRHIRHIHGRKKSDL